jgi:hemerythrin
MEWSPELSVGFEELNVQHKELLRLLAEVDARFAAVDARGAAIALGALVGAAIRHFAAEEALMERWQYPDRAAHKRAHELFLEDVRALEREEAEDGLTQDVVDWAQGRLPEWISFHMLTNDAPLGRFLALRAARAPSQGQDQVPGRALKPSES